VGFRLLTTRTRGHIQDVVVKRADNDHILDVGAGSGDKRAQVGLDDLAGQVAGQRVQ